MEQYSIRKEIKKHIKQGVPADELKVFTITEKNYRELIWLNEKEFILHGVMYDIVRKKINGIYSVTYECVSDIQETQLFAELGTLVDKTMDTKHHGQNPYKLISQLVYLEPELTSIECPVKIFTSSITLDKEEFIPEEFVRLDCPPPDFV